MPSGVRTGLLGKAEVGAKGEVTLSERGVRRPPALLEADGERGGSPQGPLRLQHWGGGPGPQERRGQSERGAGTQQPLSNQVSTEPSQAVTCRGQAAVGAGAFGRTGRGG